MQNLHPPTGGGAPPSGGGVQFALPPLTPVTKRLMILNAGIFLASWILYIVAPGVKEAIYGALALDPGQWRDWMPFVPLWQPLSYGFLHSTEVVTHVLWNLLQLYFFGTMLESLLGGRRFLTTYLACMLVGAFLHLFVEMAMGSSRPAIGASGAALGVVVAMATLRPRTSVLVLFFPVQLWLLAGLIVLIDFMSAVQGVAKGVSDGVAHWVHLGGALWGFLSVKRGWIQVDWVERFRARRAIAEEQGKREDELRMDQLLEKIHNEGMSSLTRAEKSFLKRVSGRK